MFIYIGPGMGGGIITAILGLILSFLLAILALFWIPIKRLIRFIKNKKKPN
jgi:hypothetical protein